MKTLVILLIAVQVFAIPIFAEENTDIVIKVLKQSSEEAILEIKEDTFIFNINGYACQVPGLEIPIYISRHELRHDKIMGGDARTMAIGIKDPNYEFCNAHGLAEGVFGKEFIVGSKLPLQINRVLDLRSKIVSGPADRKTRMKAIQETITIKINGRTLESKAEIFLNN